MEHPEITRLLDEAKRVSGSDYATAKRIHVSRMAVSDWRNGRKAIPVADIALLAQVAGLDPVAWTARAVAEPHEGTPKGEALQQALKKALVATGAAIVSGGAVAGDYFIRCIEVLTRKRHRPRSEYQHREGDRRHH